MSTKQKTLNALCGLALLAGLPASSHAIPTLQLTVEGGVYQETGSATFNEESTVASGNPFTLYALLKEGGDLTDTYYLSAALWPRPDSELTPAPNLGSITINGNVIDVTGDMVWGQPAALGSAHGVFDSYYTEIAFTFDASNVTTEFDAEVSTPSTALVPLALDCSSPSVKCMYFEAFEVDVGNLAKGYSIHFDLYDGGFAPFSHDAQSVTGTGIIIEPPVPPTGNTPVPGTLLLVALPLLGIAGWHRRRA